MNIDFKESNTPASMASEDSDAGIKIYLREIGRIPLLTLQQEIDLAARIKKGDREARVLIIKANLRLVVKIALDYANFGLPLLDLVSEGNIGLMKAVERFDPAKGGKLSTYGAWWIKQSIKRALANQSKTIRLSGSLGGQNFQNAPGFFADERRTWP
jgi:RNA polymerase primary sigma factor